MNVDTFAHQVFASLGVRKKTLATYRSMLKCHISPYLGKIEIESVTRQQIKELIYPLPIPTAQMTLAVIKVIFREAMDLEILQKSPVHGLNAPKAQWNPRKFLTWEELDVLSFGKYTTQIRFLALHGLRWSEAVALTPDDIRDGRIHVTKSIHGQTKSKAGVRVVPLVSPFKPLPATRRPLRRVLKPHGITIHSLRHSYAYLLKSRGVHVTTAQRLLGHSDPKVTLAIYTQVLDSEIDSTGDLLRSFIRNESAIPTVYQAEKFAS